MEKPTFFHILIVVNHISMLYLCSVITLKNSWLKVQLILKFFHYLLLFCISGSGNRNNSYIPTLVFITNPDKSNSHNIYEFHILKILMNQCYKSRM